MSLSCPSPQFTFSYSSLSSSYIPTTTITSTTKSYCNVTTNHYCSLSFSRFPSLQSSHPSSHTFYIQFFSAYVSFLFFLCPHSLTFGIPPFFHFFFRCNSSILFPTGTQTLPCPFHSSFCSITLDLIPLSLANAHLRICSVPHSISLPSSTAIFFLSLLFIHSLIASPYCLPSSFLYL